MELQKCPQCTKELHKATEKSYSCNACGFEIFLNPAPANAIILMNEHNEILLGKRKSDPQKGFLDLIGGFVDYNENADTSMLRELKEETQIEFNPDDIQLIDSYIDRYQYKTINYHILILVYTAKIPKDTPMQAGDDIVALEWHSIDKLPYKRIAFPPMRDFLKKWVQKDQK